MIEIKNIRKEWRRKDRFVRAIEDISLSIEDGKFISVIGPSGCGKTTLLRLIAGLLEPTSGSISIDRTLIRGNSIKRLSIVFQNPVLLPWRTVYENVMLPNELNGLNVHKNVGKMIKLVRLERSQNAYPGELSGGMQQRVAIARALVLSPVLLLMDEPFGALDEINRDKLNLELLRIWQKTKSTIIFVTHSISEAIFLSDKVVILSKRPSKVKEIVNIKLPRPRELGMKETLEFQGYAKWIRRRID